MFCSNCGNKNRDGSKFCTGCGSRIRKISKEENIRENNSFHNAYTDNETQEPRSKNGVFITLGVICGVIAACFIGYSTIMATLDSKEKTPNPQIQGSNNGDIKNPKEGTNTNASSSNLSINLAAKNDVNGYIAKDSSVKLLTESDLNGLSMDDLGLIRNEIYARYGYVFKSTTYADYFGSKAWYTPNSSFKGNESDINSVERDNVALIKSYEDM
ncbi:MAG: YARHG domain-containing protein [Clostridium sp.]